MPKSKYAKMLKPWLTTTEQIFTRLDKYVLDGIDDEAHRIFIDRDAKVLFVAHLDTVRKPKIRQATEKTIYGQGFDDRLGCMLAYSLSDELGADLLLTDHEESCSTSGKFHNLKDYNWIVEFDREGTDVVTYDLDNPEFSQALCNYWYKGFGSFSDICKLETDACCFNLGIGYHRAHAKRSYIDVNELEIQIKKFRRFYAEHKDIKYIREKRESNYNNYDFGFSDYEDIDTLCEFCGTTYGTTIYNTSVCRGCFEIMSNDYGFDTNGRDYREFNMREFD